MCLLRENFPNQFPSPSEVMVRLRGLGDSSACARFWHWLFISHYFFCTFRSAPKETVLWTRRTDTSLIYVLSAIFSSPSSCASPAGLILVRLCFTIAPGQSILDLWPHFHVLGVLDRVRFSGTNVLPQILNKVAV